MSILSIFHNLRLNEEYRRALLVSAFAKMGGGLAVLNNLHDVETVLPDLVGLAESETRC